MYEISFLTRFSQQRCRYIHMTYKYVVLSDIIIFAGGDTADDCCSIMIVATWLCLLGESSVTSPFLVLCQIDKTPYKQYATFGYRTFKIGLSCFGWRYCNRNLRSSDFLSSVLLFKISFVRMILLHRGPDLGPFWSRQLHIMFYISWYLTEC